MSGAERAGIVLGTFFGAGYFPLGPGTFASAVTTLICGALGAAGHGLWLGAAAAVLYFPGCWAAAVCEKVFAQRDPGRVVVDEVIGQMITLAALPAAGGWKYGLAGFILFRGFDIAKPFPIRRLERLPGGYGVVSDDVMAGLYAFGILKLALGLGF